MAERIVRIERSYEDIAERIVRIEKFYKKIQRYEERSVITP